ncbi:MAG: arylsulfatase [Actinomycetia bacterium]|nr:arylsulfatase [Actinomycetes bacterium]
MGEREEFGGVIGRTIADSTPWWPDPPAVDGKPNVVVILFDDTGFAHFGCYGSDIDTPNIDALAAGGLRYTNFHTTALCSPTRASLLTGRNHHSVGMRCISNFDTGYPHMRGRISHDAATIAEVLNDAGYATFALGKWHLCPMAETSMAGPFDDWPLQRGFDRFYGFLQGETDQFHPELTYDNHHLEPPSSRDDGYHLSEDITDRAIDFVRESKSVRPDKPFFTYLSWGATHSPHQAPDEYLEKYRGRYDDGWDETRQRWYERQLELGVIPQGTELAPHNRGVRPWSDLSEGEQKLASRLQEAFAAFLDHTDAQIGRFVEFLRSIDELDNTIFVVTSDNGASQEGAATGVIDEMRFFNGFPEDVEAAQDRLDDIGTARSHTNYPWGWAQVGNTPLKWYKQNTFGGGVRDPLVVHWPERITDTGGIRTQFHHVSDLTPTILAELGIDQPEVFKGREQLPVNGTPMGYSFDAPEAPSTKRAQYFEMFGHRGIWADGWKAVTMHRPGRDFDDDVWELYHVDEDFSEIDNRAEAEPEKLQEMIDLWWAEAEEHGVLPLDDDFTGIAFRARRPGTPHASTSYRYRPPMSRLPNEAAPAIAGRSWRMQAQIDRPAGTEEGALAAWGTSNTGFTFYVKDGDVVFDYNLFGDHHVARAPAPTGSATVEVEFERTDTGADIRVGTVGGEHGTTQAPWVLRFIGMSGMDVGRDAGSAVSDAYEGPFPFAGGFSQLDVEVTDELSPAEIYRLDRDRVKRDFIQQ